MDSINAHQVLGLNLLHELVPWLAKGQSQVASEGSKVLERKKVVGDGG